MGAVKMPHTPGFGRKYRSTWRTKVENGVPFLWQPAGGEANMDAAGEDALHFFSIS